ncbi:MAG: YdcF family protein [Vicinamibacteria bacterium]|nr:YdcF family protein [Vicinamibacteria bacterium]
MHDRRSLVTGAALGAVAGHLAFELGLASLVSWWGDRTLLPAVAALLGAGLAALPARAQRLRRGGAAVLAGLAVLWLAVLFTPLCARLAAPLRRVEPPRAADAVFVLSAHVQRDEEPTSASMSRLQRGLELLAAGHARVLVISELPAPWARYEPWARAQLKAWRLDAELVVLGPVRRTRDEAVAVSRLFRERGWQSVLLATSPSHSRRAAESFEACGLQVISAPGVETRWDEPGFPERIDRLAAFGSLVHEWGGLAYYRWRGWLGPGAGPCA